MTRAYIVSAVFGSGAGQILVNGLWLANAPEGAAALSVQKALHDTPGLPPLVSIGATEITLEMLEKVSELLRNQSADGPLVHLELVKPEGLA